MNLYPYFTHIVNRVCTPKWKINPRTTTFHNLILVYDGQAVFHRNGAEAKVSKGDLIYFRKDDFRQAYTNPKNLMKCYAVDFIYTCPAPDTRSNCGWELKTEELPFDYVQHIDNTELFNRLCLLFDMLSKMWLLRNHDNDIESCSLFLQIMCLLLDKTAKGYNNFDKKRKVEILINYMTENMKNPIKLNDLYGLIKVKPTYLINMFNEVTGLTPINYLLNLRLNKAKCLLMEGYSVTAAAFETGFRDVYYFSKYFKRHEGMSPSRFKK